MDGDAILLCLCSCPDATSAEQLAGALVGERLAACINIVPGLRSVFRWQGSVQRESEVLLLVKTCADRLDALAAAITQLHPYELPEILALTPSAGLPAYLDWIRAQTREEDPR